MAEAEAKISEQEVTEAEGTGPSDVIVKDKSTAEAVEEKNPEPDVMVTGGDQPEKGEGSQPEDVVQAGTAVANVPPVIQDQVADEGNGVGLAEGDVAGTSGLGKGMETQVGSGLAADAVNGVEEIVAAPSTAQVGAAAGTKQPKRRGRPPKPIPEGALISTPKRRGRPPKKIETEAKEEAPAPVEEASVQPASGAVPVPVEIEAAAKEKEEIVAPKKRGRPRAAIKEETPIEAPKKRGRPTLADKDKVPAPLSGKEAQKLVGVRLET
eukprot:TRINITY_DN16196_c0_g1_i2.p1 TRINITY_DN16196_c0_g1~~TRINITY_DN16196_c0_g1_i2.p1  ORF type:complete len:267 (-),score=94.00 TRINITY_DN16196_c0_g1_i2:768-1568(-)